MKVLQKCPPVRRSKNQEEDRAEWSLQILYKGHVGNQTVKAAGTELFLHNPSQLSPDPLSRQVSWDVYHYCPFHFDMPGKGTYTFVFLLCPFSP